MSSGNASTICRESNRRLVFRNIEMQHAATVMRQDDEDVEDSKLYGCNREEVDRDHLAHMVSRNVIQVCDGFPVIFGIKRETVRSEILNPNFFSSPCIRGAPHVGLAVDMDI